MATVFLGASFQKLTLDTNAVNTPRKSHFCDGQNIPTIIAAGGNYSLAVMKQVLEDIQNQNYIILEQISL